MMRLPPFSFLVPRSLGEAVQQLAEAGPQARPVAGGTDLYPNMKRLQGGSVPPVVVGLHEVRELAQVRRTDDGGLSLGAGVTLTHLAEHPLVQAHCPSLAAAALLISTLPLRNMGTLGGNLCLDTRCHYINQTAFWRAAVGSCLKDVGDVCRVALSSPRCLAITSADLPPLLIALGARVRLVSAQGERTILLDDLYRDDGINYLTLAPGELVSEVLVPPLGGWRATYLKLRRRDAFDFPALGVAAAVRCGSDGAVLEARLVLGAVTSRPLVISLADLLVGQKLSPEVSAGLAQAVVKQAKPLDLADFTHGYRKQMVGVYVNRALRQLASASPDLLRQVGEGGA